MSVKRYIASQDTIISDAFERNLQTRATGSNMGLSDILEVFSIYGQASSGSLEKARILVQFPTSQISNDRTSGDIPASGSVKFFLHLSNARHSETLPRNFTLTVHALSRSWEEGDGLDAVEYSDLSYGGPGANWVYSAQGTQWSTQGGDFLTSSYTPGSTMPSYSQTFDAGIEDLDVDITSMVEEWLGGQSDNGVMVKMSGSYEDGSGQRSYYTKKFFARGSEFWFKRPYIEARWNSATKDQRGNFKPSSSLLTADDNLQTLYLYNFVNGALKDIPGISNGNLIFVETWTSSSGGTQQTTTPDQPVTGGWVSTGIYSASFAVSTTASVLYDRWYSGSVAYHTGSFTLVKHNASNNVLGTRKYHSNIINLQSSYRPEDVVRFKLFSRLRNSTPTLYSIATAEVTGDIIDEAYWKLVRKIDNFTVVDYGTGSSNPYTKMSYDKEGNYWDLDMGMLEPGFMYELRIAYLINGRYEEQPEKFKFKVQDEI